VKILENLNLSLNYNMPYKLLKLKGGKFKVQNKDTLKTYSKKPMTKEKATKQMSALYLYMKH
jgi:hypothetical protein